MWARHEHVECGYGRVGEREAVGDPGQYRIHSYRSLSCHEHTEPGVLRKWTVITGGRDSATSCGMRTRHCRRDIFTSL